MSRVAKSLIQSYEHKGATVTLTETVQGYSVATISEKGPLFGFNIHVFDNYWDASWHFSDMCDIVDDSLDK